MQHLIGDIETIREHLQIARWDVFGGSWGSTLSLAYAQAHPAHVKSLTLRGIFTLRKAELDFFYQGPGTSMIFPDYWEQYLKPIPVEERGDMVKAYYKRLTGENEEERAAAGMAWSVWEMATSRLFVDPAVRFTRGLRARRLTSTPVHRQGERARLCGCLCSNRCVPLCSRSGLTRR